MEGKQHIEPIPKSTTRKMEARELTHIDLGGKYAIRSIKGNQYYLLFVDDATRYVTINFFKEKSAAAQGIIKYLAHLIIQGQKPKVIQIDGGKEFVNQKLESWCKEQGIEIHSTAPYSPSQNGVAEQMNHTLVELAHAMLAQANSQNFYGNMQLHMQLISKIARTPNTLKTKRHMRDGWRSKDVTQIQTMHLCWFWWWN
jgi:transposase InsO family protein